MDQFSINQAVGKYLLTRVKLLEDQVEDLKTRCDFSDEMLGIVMKDLHYLKYGEVLETEEVGEA